MAEINLEHLESLGRHFAKSMMFGCSNESQGVVMALECLMTKTSPMALQATYHIISGRPSMKADAMLSAWRKSGGKHRWLKDGSDGQSATLELIDEAGNSQAVSYTIEEAKKAGLVKPGGGWTKNPANMLRARCCSNGVRMLKPELLGGAYTPEEIQDMELTGQPQPEHRTKRQAGNSAPAGVAATATAAAAASEKASIDPTPVTETASEPVAPAQSTPDPNPLQESTLELIGHVLAELKIVDDSALAILRVIGCPVDPEANRPRIRLCSEDQLHEVRSHFTRLQQIHRMADDLRITPEQWAKIYSALNIQTDPVHAQPWHGAKPTDAEQIESHFAKKVAQQREAASKSDAQAWVEGSIK
jgi:hypothetical protein